MLLTGTEIALIATAVLYIALRQVWITYVGVAVLAAALVLIVRIALARRRAAAGPTVGVGTVCAWDGDSAADERQVFVEVVAVSGGSFVGRLARSGEDQDLSVLRPGLVVLVAFDPAAREELSLPDDVLAVRASWLAAI